MKSLVNGGYVGSISGTVPDFRCPRLSQVLTSLQRGAILVLGFLGGRGLEPWKSPPSSVRRFAVELQTMRLPGSPAETF